MKNVMVTGGAGFIGSNFVRYLLAHEPRVKILNLDALTYAGSRENLRDLPDPDRHKFVRGDICDRKLMESLLREYEIDTIVHFAAESHVDRSITGPASFIETNIIGTFTLLEAVRQIWLEEKLFPPDQIRFLHVSTDEVFGSLKLDEPAFSEATAYAPNSPYAASKASSDHLVRAYAHTYGLPVLITNCTNNYGPYQHPEKLIPLVILNALEGKSIPIYGDGKQIRDWLYVKDHCEAIHFVLREGQVGETYGIGGGNQPTNLRVVQKICEIFDALKSDLPWAPHDKLIEFVKDRPGHDRRYAMNTSKIRQKLGWEPAHTLDEGLLKTTQWYLENSEWVEKVSQRQTYQQWVQQNYAERPPSLNN